MHVVPWKQLKCIVFNAQVVELVDTLASGASGLTAVEVRVFFWAPIIYQYMRTEFKTRFRRVFYCLLISIR